MKATATLLFLLFIGYSSCKKDCQFANPVCLEAAPTNEACQAHFQRWFYDQESKSCVQIAYSGCSQKGFETKQECEACKCK